MLRKEQRLLIIRGSTSTKLSASSRKTVDPIV
jgi:hypothetical protein